MKNGSIFHVFWPEVKMNWHILDWLGFGIFISFLSYSGRGAENGVVSLSPYPTESFRNVIIFMAFLMIFNAGRTAFGTTKIVGVPSMGSLEFFFTRAISRRALFYGKASLYFCICLIPLGMTSLYTAANPAIKVKLPYHNLERREQAEQFYLAQFEGAHLEVAKKEGDRDKSYVVLPTGRRTRAQFSFVLNLLTALLFQVASFVAWGSLWKQGMVWIVLLVSPFFATRLTFSIGIPSAYERGLAFVGQHPVVVFTGLGLLLIFSQSYCCRRFIHTEIAS